MAVTGVSAAGLATLLHRFPALLAALGGGNMSAETLAEAAPEALAAVIAAGTGSPGDSKAEAVAATLSASEQLDLLSAIIAETMPQGVEDFVRRLESLATAATGGRGAPKDR
nr:hypothetical protein [Niveispirillum lacus]